jgi:hypothetical protein
VRFSSPPAWRQADIGSRPHLPPDLDLAKSSITGEVLHSALCRRNSSRHAASCRGFGSGLGEADSGRPEKSILKNRAP